MRHRWSCRAQRRELLGAILLAGAGMVCAPGQAGAQAAPTRAIPWADPDSLSDARFGLTVTVGTSVDGFTPCGERAFHPRIVVPYVIGEDPSACITGDAMPSGPGPWAAPDSPIWAPSIIDNGRGQYVMHYAAQKPWGQWCIGRAIADVPWGPYQNQVEFACPPAGRWAIDPDSFLDPDGAMYVTYRDDYITSAPNTGISVVRTDHLGAADWSTRRDALLSTDIGWGWVVATQTNVVENPSMLRGNDGHWYLLFSGNQWDSPAYAVGIADCGLAPIPWQRCTPLARRDLPYFGYRTDPWGPGLPLALPENRPGPGGMSAYASGDGIGLVWHWWDPFARIRHRRHGRLVQTSGSFAVH